MPNPRQNSHLEHLLLVFERHLRRLGSTAGGVIFIRNSHDAFVGVEVSQIEDSHDEVEVSWVENPLM